MGDKDTASLKGPKLKLERAEQHVGDLIAAIERFIETNPYDGVIKDNSETGRREYTITRADPLPDSLGLIAGDVIHNLRSALDHLIWQLILANGGEPNSNAAFPVWRSEAKFISGRPGYAKGISKPALDVLYGLHPYKGGNEALWRIHKLDIMDKHRLLLTVATRHESLIIDFGEVVNRWFEQEGIEQKTKFPSMVGELNPADRDIIGVDSVLFSAPLGDDAHDNLKANLQVALYEPEIPIYEPLVKALHELTSFVGEVLALFEPLLD